MSQNAQRELKPWAGIWPVNLTGYSRSPQLTDAEQKALASFVKQCPWEKQMAIPRGLKTKLSRLLRPLHHIQELLGIPVRYCTPLVHILLQEMQERGTSYWSWSET